jgi:hypothetical protein
MHVFALVLFRHLSENGKTKPRKRKWINACIRFHNSRVVFCVTVFWYLSIIFKLLYFIFFFDKRLLLPLRYLQTFLRKSLTFVQKYQSPWYCIVMKQMILSKTRCYLSNFLWSNGEPIPKLFVRQQSCSLFMLNMYVWMLIFHYCFHTYTYFPPKSIVNKLTVYT